jgi:hypothetical protein
MFREIEAGKLATIKFNVTLKNNDNKKITAGKEQFDISLHTCEMH